MSDDYPTPADPTPPGIWVGQSPHVHYEKPEWQPIETAPRDGRWLHAYSPRLDRTLVMKFKESSGHFVDIYEQRRENWAAPGMQPTLWAPWLDGGEIRGGEQ